jgi:maltodextrin utilization protein YvdJ
VSGNFVENLNSNVNMLNNKTGLCDNEIVDIDEQNEIENNQLENELRRGSSSNMLVSQSFYTQERFKVLLGEYVVFLFLIHVYLTLVQNAYLFFAFSCRSLCFCFTENIHVGFVLHCLILDTVHAM